MKSLFEEVKENHKITLCVLTTQFGKTFTTIERIVTEVKQDSENGKSLHLVFTMNTLLNNKQFAKRLDSIEDRHGKGSVCVFSSKYNGKYKHVKNRVELQGYFLDEKTCPRVVVMCSNYRRYDDGVEFIKLMDKIKNKNIYRIFSYYDELHAYISDNVRQQIEDIHELEIVKGIIALTATPTKIFKSSGFWHGLRQINLDNFNDLNYAGYKDMIFNCVDDFSHPYIGPFSDEFDTQTLGFIPHVLDKYPDIIQENTFTFIPAHIRRTGHNSVRDLVFRINKNTVVILINGFEKTIQYNDPFGNIKTIPISFDDEELCETISRLIIQHGLQKRPIVITGFLCVSMGQTLTHKLLGSFTSAIFGHLDISNDEIYQLFGRITGRMKGWGDKYKQTQVYCPTTIMHRCNVMEECAINIARDHNDDIITQEIYQEPMRNMGEIGESTLENIRKPRKPRCATKNKAEDTDKQNRVFDKQKDALAFANKELGRPLRKKDVAPKVLRQQNGRNPSSEYLFARMWGLNEKNPVRMYPTCDNKWCVYWRPSLIKNEGKYQPPDQVENKNGIPQPSHPVFVSPEGIPQPSHPVFVSPPEGIPLPVAHPTQAALSSSVQPGPVVIPKPVRGSSLENKDMYGCSFTT